MLFYFGDFEEEDARSRFLDKLQSKQEIELWVEQITSKMVMKFDEEDESLGEFVFYNSEVKNNNSTLSF